MNNKFVDSFLYEFDEQQQKKRKQLLEQTLAEERRLGAEARRLAEMKADEARRAAFLEPPRKPAPQPPVQEPTKQAPKLNRKLLLL